MCIAAPQRLMKFRINQGGNMHEEARLTCPFPVAGKGTGDTVSISLVEKHYKTSEAANSALSFVCADCSVPVSARIIRPFVPGRKVTPSSGFRASDRKKPHTCDREPQLTVETTPPTSGTAPAHSSQGNAPERWVDPRKGIPTSGTSSTTHLPASGTSGGTSRGRSGPATGQSIGQSQTVEKFSREWREMSLAQRKRTPLMAPWNEQGRGSYFSAFHPLGYSPDVTPDVWAIYEGTARHVTSRVDGFEVELHEQLPDGLPLHVWISTVCCSIGAAGKHLASQLLQLSLAPASSNSIYIYALGAFKEWPQQDPNRFFLEVEHPHMCWIE